MNPKVFLSHASEDKERFVLQFATALRAKGVDVWLDQWEMLPGDSLVDKLFEEGIGQADAFLVVLSQNSVGKSWVMQELNTAIVDRIKRGTKLIPVLIDNVEVPKALTSTVWLHAEDTARAEDAARRVAAAVFGVHEKPPLGPTPAYTNLRFGAIPTLTETDTLVLKLACEIYLAKGPVDAVYDKELAEAAARYDVSPEALVEAVEVLHERGYLRARWVGGQGFAYVKIADYGFEEYAEAFVPGFQDTIDNIAIHIINSNEKQKVQESKEIAERLNLNEKLAGRIVSIMADRGWIRATSVGGSNYIIKAPSVQMRREYLAERTRVPPMGERARTPGIDRGSVRLAQDFDAPLPDDLIRGFEGE